MQINDEYENGLFCHIRRMDENQTRDSVKQMVILHRLIQAQRNTDKKTEWYRLNRSCKEGEEDRDQEDIALIEECERTPVSPRAPDSATCIRKKKRKKFH